MFLFQCLLVLTFVIKYFIKKSGVNEQVNSSDMHLQPILIIQSTKLEPPLNKISIGKHQHHGSHQDSYAGLIVQEFYKTDIICYCFLK
jgi:hypothetical protein